MDPQNPLIVFDHFLFSKINLDWTNSFFDWFFPAITDLHKSPWILLIVLPLIAFWISKQRIFAVKCLCALVLAVALSDLVSFRLVKNEVQRARPPNAGVTVVLRTHRFSGPSFPSNHAANLFAAAVVLSFSLPLGAPLFFAFAFLVAYSRIYVGVHFPLDVAGGALIGLLVGVLVWLLLKKWIFAGRPMTKQSQADGV